MTSTEHKEWQQAEQQSRIQSSALEAAANGIILTDKAGKILFANKAFCAMTGYAPEEILGKTPGFLNSGKHDANFFRELWDTILTGRVWQGELINRRKDGTIYAEEMTITPIQGTNGETSHFIAVKQDITKRKQFKEQWHQAQKMEAIGKLAGNVAHDFTNLLTVIHGNANWCWRMKVNLRSRTANISNKSPTPPNAPRNLTRQLLAFGRKQVIQFQPLSLNDVISSYTKMLNRVIGEHITLQCCYAEDSALRQTRTSA